MTKKMKSALEKVTSDLLALDEKTFKEKLEAHKDGPISTLFKYMEDNNNAR